VRIANAARAVCLTGAMAILAVPARAGYIISIQQVGSDVVATGSGSLDTTGLNFSRNSAAQGLINANEAQVYLGPTTPTANTQYGGVTGPLTLGTLNANNFFSSGSGPAVGVLGDIHDIFVPVGYASGTLLGASTDTLSNKTLSNLGLTPGTYTYSWGTGLDADSLSVQVIPEPVGITHVAAAGIWLLRRGRRLAE
jgi:hypothetical protein